MQLNIRALAITGAVLAGGSLLLMGILNLVFSGYAMQFLELGASIYPGYSGPDGLVSVVVVTLYGLLDGAIAGGITAWCYNYFVASSRTSATG